MAPLEKEKRFRGRNILNEDIRRYVLGGTEATEQGWGARPEIPTSDEIMGTTTAHVDGNDIIHLIPNQVTTPWPSTKIYLKAHYELLREDAVSPLRDAVAYARENRHLMDSSTAAIYENVCHEAVLLYFLPSYFSNSQIISGSYHWFNILPKRGGC
jgi:helicase required for RNAi-mediated heterochromatin assembly 1